MWRPLDCQGERNLKSSLTANKLPKFSLHGTKIWDISTQKLIIHTIIQSTQEAYEVGEGNYFQRLIEVLSLYQEPYDQLELFMMPGNSMLYWKSSEK